MIDHIDGDRSNNALSNLRVVTQSENMDNAQRNGHGCQVRVKQYDSMGNFIKEYNSYAKAAAAIDGNESAIRQAAVRHGRSKGFFWIAEGDETSIEDIVKKAYAYAPGKHYIGVIQHDKDYNEIQRFESLEAAARANKITAGTIKNVIDEKRFYKNCYWDFIK